MGKTHVETCPLDMDSAKTPMCDSLVDPPSVKVDGSCLTSCSKRGNDDESVVPRRLFQSGAYGVTRPQPSSFSTSGNEAFGRLRVEIPSGMQDSDTGFSSGSQFAMGSSRPAQQSRSEQHETASGVSCPQEA